MHPLVETFRKAVISGSSASIISTAALFAGGVRDCRHAMAPINAVSHWLWKDEALRQNHATLRYTANGYLIHHAASVFWAVAYQHLMTQPALSRNKTARAFTSATIVAATACAVDLYLTPTRLTPGFERRLGGRSLTGVYIAFGIGLFLATRLSRGR